MRGVRTIIIGIILILAGCGLFGVIAVYTVNAEKICDDWNTISGRFKSYSSGDTITIVDEINDIQFVREHYATGERVDWTFITLKSVGLSIDDVAYMASDPSKIWGFIIFNGDLTDSFNKGDRVEIHVRVVDLKIVGQEAEILDWYEDLLNAFLNADDLEDMSFADLDMAQQEDISHYTFLYEIGVGVIISIGVIVLIVGIVRIRKSKKVKFRIVDEDRYDDKSPYGYTPSSHIHEPYAQPPAPEYVRGERAEWSYSDTYKSRPTKNTENAYDNIWNEMENIQDKPMRSQGRMIHETQKTREKFKCPKCGNMMMLTLPYRPYKCHCDNCGIAGIIR